MLLQPCLQLVLVTIIPCDSALLLFMDIALFSHTIIIQNEAFTEFYRVLLLGKSISPPLFHLLITNDTASVARSNPHFVVSILWVLAVYRACSLCEAEHIDHL